MSTQASSPEDPGSREDGRIAKEREMRPRADAGGRSTPRARQPVSRRGFGSYVLLFASASAQAVASPELGALSPCGVAHPPASMTSRCLHDSIFWNSASLVAAPGCCMNLVTQAGVSATTTAALVRSAARRSAVLPRVQPNQEKPTNMVATAPTTTPQAAGLNHGFCSCMSRSSGCRGKTCSGGDRSPYQRPPREDPPKPRGVPPPLRVPPVEAFSTLS